MSRHSRNHSGREIGVDSPIELTGRVAEIVTIDFEKGTVDIREVPYDGTGNLYSAAENYDSKNKSK